MTDVKVKFVTLSAPSIVQSSDLPNLRQLPNIKAAFAAVPAIDIIVTSGTCWHDEHSALRNLMERFPESLRALEARNCVYDLHWRPLSPKGPITTETGARALTLIELTDLPGLIKQGKHVLLSLGPCGLCNTHKGPLLKCLLELPQQLMTDLVVDTRTADHALNS